MSHNQVCIVSQGDGMGEVVKAHNRVFQFSQSLSSPPKLKRNHLCRHDLCVRLESICEDSVAVIVAPPGYGKSSLMAEWCQSLQERSDTLVCYLRISQHADLESIVALLADYSERIVEACGESSAYCIIEDVHNLTDGQLASVFDYVAELQSMGVHTAITSTAWCHALLGLCANVEITALSKEFLRFTHEETRQYIEKNTGGRASEEYVEAVYNYTQGWQAGVCLLSVNIELNNITESFARNKYIHGYFSSLVDSQCDSAMSDFLFSTSFLDELKPDLCAHIMNMRGTSDLEPEMQAASMLDEIESRGLFLQRETNDIGSAAHYEKPFRLWLQGTFAASRLSRTQEANRAACNWYIERRDDVQAVKHLLMSGDAMSNFDDVRAIAENGVQDRNTEDWLQWVSSLSRADVVANPAFDVLAGWFFIRNGQYREASKCVAMGNEALGGNVSLNDEEAELICAHLRCIEAKCLNMSGKDREYIDAYGGLLSQRVIADNIGLRCIMTFSLAESLERIGDITQSQQCYREAIALSELCGDVYARGLSAYNLARRCIEEGNLYEAEQLCRANMTACTNPYRGLLYVLIAHLDMLAYRVDEAKEALESAHVLLSEGNMDFRLDYRIAQSIVDEQADRLDAACSSMMHAVIFARQNQLHLRSILVRLQARWAYLLFRKRDYRRCRDVLSEIDQGSDSGIADNMLKMKAVEIRLALVDGDIDDAQKNIASALDCARESKCVIRMTELRILESYMHTIAGERDKAYLRMAEALDEGARCGLMGLFVREGESIVDILNESMSKRKLKRSTRRFCEETLANINGPESNRESSRQAPVYTRRDLLTERERQILDLLNKGMSRKEIADELHIAYNTVKVHISHIYEKLGVDNKLDAFHVAREQKGL